MANAVYPNFKEALGRKLVDVVVDTMKIQAYESDVAYDVADTFLADLAGTQVGAAVELTTRDFTDGQFTADPTVTFSWPNGFTVAVLIVYQDTGNPVTSRVAAWLDSKGDGTAISIATTGAVLNLHWIDPFFSIGG